MAALRRLAKTVSAWRILLPSSAPSRDLPRRLPNRSFERQIHFNASEIGRPRLFPGVSGPRSVFPAILASLFGAGLINIAYSDAGEAGSAKPPLAPESSSSYGDLEEIAKKERQRIEELIKKKGQPKGFYPRFTVAVKGQKITIKFQVPHGCEVPQLIANLVSNLGLKVEEHGGGSDMSLRAWDSAVAWQLTLRHPGKLNKHGGDQAHSTDMNTHEDDLCILIFRSLITSDKAEIEFIKKGSLSSAELDAFVSTLQLAGGRLGQNRNLDRKPRDGYAQETPVENTISTLESMGVRIYGLGKPQVNSSNTEISWENIAGYDQQKREIEDTVLLSLQNPEIFDDIARGTRRKFESNRPRAVLFEGPPGTGKTSCARVIANQAGAPLVYLPLEVIMSKYYGESERLLGKVFTLADKLPNGAIIFLDEVDSLAISRDSEMHEATRRILSVLLRQIDGFEQDKKVIVIAATNRKQDLDPALMSRFDSCITFGLPDHQTRQEIAASYAKHLSESDLLAFASVTEEMSGRDIRDVCQQAERTWASKIIRGQATKDGDKDCLPPLQEYIESALNRQKSLLNTARQNHQKSYSPTKKQPLDLY
ncbi:katanin p60 ATPase-containing subunit A1 [Mangifera indica]|uniref:katanin p60 ATPase-containing subunit A1 n=1 Tax=Mangifera indica TaxID=29780 RepID=UPI001CF94ED1|nr:katanin p60 ATPase-containing subunit A1 [Mangifera indica]